MATLKVTIDNGLLREKVLDPSIRILRDWELDGKIEIFESDKSKVTPTNSWPGQQVVSRSTSRRSTKKQPGSLSFNAVSAILFPNRDAQKLAIHEVNSVTRLISHHLAERSFFITNNESDYIRDGKQEKIKTALNIVVLSPREAVDQISRWMKQSQK